MGRGPYAMLKIEYVYICVYVTYICANESNTQPKDMYIQYVYIYINLYILYIYIYVELRKSQKVTCLYMPYIYIYV